MAARNGEQQAKAVRTFCLPFHSTYQLKQSVQLGLCNARGKPLYYGCVNVPDATGMVRPPTNTSVTNPSQSDARTSMFEGR